MESVAIELRAMSRENGRTAEQGFTTTCNTPSAALTAEGGGVLLVVAARLSRARYIVWCAGNTEG